MKNKVEVEIIGGIGNQLFSYVCGYCMAKKNDALLYLDLDSYKNYFRPYKLDRLNIVYSGVKKHLLPHRIRAIYRKCCLNYIREKRDFVYENIYEKINWGGYICRGIGRVKNILFIKMI